MSGECGREEEQSIALVEAGKHEHLILPVGEDISASNFFLELHGAKCCVVVNTASALTIGLSADLRTDHRQSP